MAAELAAGWALLAVGLAAWVRRPATAFGPLLAAGAFGWFALEWNNPGIGSAPGFALGLALYAAAPPLVAHAALVYPNRRLPWPERLVVAIAYIDALLVLGLGSALVFDPSSGLCTECPSNPLLVEGSSRAFDLLNRVGVHIGLGWAVAAGVLVGLRLARSSSAARPSLWPVLVPAAAYLGLVGLTFADSLERGALGTGTTQRDLWLAQALALIALAAGVAWAWIRARYRRAAVARLVVDIAESPAPGELCERLGRMLGDPSLEIGYPLAGGRLVDADGRAIALEGDVTPLVRGAETVALLSHRPGLLDDPALAEEVAAPPTWRSSTNGCRRRSGRSSRSCARREAGWSPPGTASVTGSSETSTTERSSGSSPSRSASGSLRSTDAAHHSQIDEAQAELDAALASLREVGHGLFPALLAEEGLAAALEALTEEAPVEIEIGPFPQARLDPALEAAAYFLVSEALKRSRGVPDRLVVRMEQNRLVVDVIADIPAGELVGLEDRVGAVGGTLDVRRQAGGRVSIRAEIPCGS